MTDQAHYIIQKQILDIRHGEGINAYARQTEISERYKNEALPLLEKACRELCPGDRLVKIDRLVVELPAMNQNSYKTTWSEALEKEFRKQLSQAIAQVKAPEQTNTRILSHTEAGLRLLSAFLYTGTFPWSYTARQNRDPETLLRELIKKEPEKIQQLVTEGLKRESFIKRLCYQFPVSLLSELFSMLEPGLADVYRLLQQGFEYTGYSKDKSHTAFLINYHSFAQLAQKQHRDEKQFIVRVLRPVANRWNVPYRELINSLITSVKSKLDSGQKAALLPVLEALYEDPTAALEAQKTRQKDSGSSVRELSLERETAGNRLREEMVQLLGEAKKTMDTDKEDKAIFPEGFKAGLLQLIASIEKKARKESSIYKKLGNTLKEWLGEIVQIADPAGEEKAMVLENIRKRLESWIKRIEKEARKAAAAYTALEKALKEWLGETAQIADSAGEEKAAMSENLRKLLKHHIKQIEKETNKSSTAYSALDNALKEWLGETAQIATPIGKDNIMLSAHPGKHLEMWIKQLEKETAAAGVGDKSLAKDLEKLFKETERATRSKEREKALLFKEMRARLEQFIRMIENDTSLSGTAYKNLAENLRQLLETSGSEHTAYKAFRKSLRALLEGFLQREADKKHTPKPETVPGTHFQEVLRQMLEETEQITRSTNQEKATLLKAIRDRLEQFIRMIENDTSLSGTAYKSLAENLRQLLEASGQEPAAYEAFGKSLRALLEGFLERGGAKKYMPKPETHFQKALQQMLEEAEYITNASGEESAVRYKRFKADVKAFVRKFKPTDETSARDYKSYKKGLRTLLKAIFQRRKNKQTIAVNQEITGENSSREAFQQLIREAERLINTDEAHEEQLLKVFKDRLLQCMLLTEKHKPGETNTRPSAALDKSDGDKAPDSEASPEAYQRLKTFLEGVSEDDFSKEEDQWDAHGSAEITADNTSLPVTLDKSDGDKTPDSEASPEAYQRLKTFLKEISGEEDAWHAPKWHHDGDVNTEEIYLENAGLVIVWPFFTQLFEELELTEKKRFAYEDKRYRAIHLLQYLASGEAICDEHRLSLNKLLCGLGLNEPVSKALSLPQHEKESAEDLIKAAITHWPMMKNTSVEGFREAFLIRDGKLSRSHDGWLLQVTQKGYDVIMDKLPWGIGLVKLPWMPEPLFVEW